MSSIDAPSMSFPRPGPDPAGARKRHTSPASRGRLRNPGGPLSWLISLVLGLAGALVGYLI